MVDPLVVHQVLYSICSGTLLFLYSFQICLRFYRVHYDLPEAAKYSSTQTVYHWCGVGASILYCIRAIDPYGQYGILSVPLLFILSNTAVQLVILAGFYTIYEALCACFHVVGLLHESKIPRVVGFTLTFIWSGVCMTVILLDLVIYMNPLRMWLAVVHFVDTIPFFFLIIFLQRIGRDLQKVLYSVLPDLFQQTQGLSPTLINSTPVTPSMQHIHHKINKFLILRRIVQALSVAGFITGIIRAISFLRKGGELDTEPGHYNVEDDIIGWILIIAGGVGVWYSWAPIRPTNVQATAIQQKKKKLGIGSNFSAPDSMVESLTESEYYTRSEYPGHSYPGPSVLVGSYQ